ncbi:MAG: hypothetical protein M3337_05615 [Actinomycetota bacterium]|nr:hypothetical protein [Actinomycetota bacterium]
MTALAVVFGVLALVAIIVAVVTRRHLGAGRLALAAVNERSQEQARDLGAAESARADANRARSEAEARASTSEERATASEHHKDEADADAQAASQRATAAEKVAASAEERARVAEDARTSAEDQEREARQQARAEIDAATNDARLAAARATEAQARANGAEQRATELAAATATTAVAEDGSEAGGQAAGDVGDETSSSPVERAKMGDGLDPRLMWTLEQLRSERTWRQSVAVGTETCSVFDGAEDPLLEALQVEVDALREEVGVVIDLDAELPNPVSAAGSVLMLRVAQELLAGVVHGSEETILRVHADDHDVLVTVKAVDEAGRPVEPPLLLGEPSAAAEPVDGGVRLRNVVADG